MKYAAFLRGINVGGNAIIKMADLKTTLEKEGFENVKTILASGNVVFDATKNDARKIAKKIETALEKKYKRPIAVIVQPIEELQKLDAAKPFKSIKVTPDVRLYVTFLYEKPKSHLKTPSEFFRILKTSDTAICSVLTITADRGSLDLMGALEKHYGKKITTRNWNTIQKILALK